MKTMDEAFGEYLVKTFGAHATYPLDTYTHFCAGWKAAKAVEAANQPVTKPQN